MIAYFFLRICLAYFLCIIKNHKQEVFSFKKLFQAILSHVNFLCFICIACFVTSENVFGYRLKH